MVLGRRKIFEGMSILEPVNANEQAGFSFLRQAFRRQPICNQLFKTKELATRSMKLHFIQEVIRAMSPSEKRLFKLHGAGVGSIDRKWLKLFDLLNKLDEVATKTVKAKLGVTDSGLAKLADHLFQQLMAYQDQTNAPDAQAWLRWAKTLVHSGQVESARVAIAKASRLADQEEGLALHLEILEWQRAIAETEEERAQIGAAYLVLAEQQRRFLDLKLLRGQLAGLIKARTHGNALALESLRQHPALGDNLPETRAVRLEYLKCWRILHTFAGDYRAATRNAEQLVSEYAQADARQYLLEYADELNSLVQLYILAGQAQQARTRLMQMAQLQQGESALDARIHLMSVVTLLAWRLDDLDLEEGKVIVEETEAWLLQQQGHLEQRLVERFMYHAMRLEFFSGAYAKCLKWQMRLVSLPGMSASRNPMKVWARCYQLLSIIALEDYDWGMDAIIRQISRAAKEETPNFELPGLITKIGRHFDRVGKPDAAQLQKWLSQADVLAADPVQGRTLRQFIPLDAILESWITQASLAQTERIKREAIPVPPRQQAEQA